MERNFFVSEKADGTRFLLFIHCLPINDESPQQAARQECFLVDRKNAYYHVPNLQFPSTQLQSEGKRSLPLLDNTLLDGELVFDRLDNGETIARFLIFDIVMLEGQDLSQKPFNKRLGKLHEFVLKPFEHMKQMNSNVPMTIEMKKMELSYGLGKVLDEIPTLKHGNDGLIFTDADSSYTFGTCEAMVKWKPPEMNTIDFRLRYDPQTSRWFLDVLVRTGEYQEFGQFTPPDQSWYSRAAEFDGKIAECKFDSGNPTKWSFMRFREDKNTPNHVSVVPKILQSIEEGIGQAEVLLTFYSVYFLYVTLAFLLIRKNLVD
jgi:mRNA guanylyltransferase